MSDCSRNSYGNQTYYSLSTRPKSTLVPGLNIWKSDNRDFSNFLLNFILVLILFRPKPQGGDNSDKVGLDCIYIDKDPHDRKRTLVAEECKQPGNGFVCEQPAKLLEGDVDCGPFWTYYKSKLCKPPTLSPTVVYLQ